MNKKKRIVWRGGKNYVWSPGGKSPTTLTRFDIIQKKKKESKTIVNKSTFFFLHGRGEKKEKKRRKKRELNIREDGVGSIIGGAPPIQVV